MNKRKLKDRKSIRYVDTFIRNTKISMTYKIAFVKFMIISGWILKYYIDYLDYQLLNKIVMLNFKTKKRKTYISNPFVDKRVQVKSKGIYNEEITNESIIFSNFHRTFIFKATKKVECTDAIESFLKSITFENFKLILFMLSPLNCSKLRFFDYVNESSGLELYINLDKYKQYVIRLVPRAFREEIVISVHKANRSNPLTNALILECISDIVVTNVKHKESSTEITDEYKKIFYTMFNERKIDEDAKHLAQILSITD